MEPAVRRHIKIEIDAAARKREGLRPVEHGMTKQKNVDPGKRYSDAELDAVLKACARDLRVSVKRLTLAQYRNWREADKTRGPSDVSAKKRRTFA